MHGGEGRGARGSAGPRLLASTAPLLFAPLDWALDAIAEAGFGGAELLVAHDPASRDPDTVLRRARESGLTIPVVHGPYMLVLRSVLGSDYVDKTRRSLELASAVGARTMVAHAPFRWERRARAWLAAEADAEADEHGAAFAMENLFPVAGRAFSSVITPGQLTGFRRVVFDTSHFAVAGVDLIAAWDALADRVVHVHLSDNFGNGKDSHAPIGSGVLPLARFLGHVGRSGYAGTVTVEVDCRAYADSRAGLVEFLSGERAKAETLLAAPGPPPTASVNVPRGS